MAAFAKSGVGSSADDKPSRRAGSAFCAGLGRHILHPADRSGGHIRACPESLVASPAPIACQPSQFLRRRRRARDFILLISVHIRGPLSGASRKTFALSLTASDPERLKAWYHPPLHE
jgi:hypothetical protein